MRQGKRSFSTWALVLTVAIGAVGCRVFDPSLVEPLDASGVDAPTQDAPSADRPNMSGLRKVPPRPTSNDGPDIEATTYVLRDVVLNQDADRWRDIGLDLDDLFTRPPVPEVECMPPNESADPELDGNEGVDNAFGNRLFPIVRLARPDIERNSRINQAAGLGAILLHVTRWNGERNDPRVTVVLSQSAAGTSADPASVRFEGTDLVNVSDGAPAPPPAWDGTDHWWARDDTFFMRMEARPLIRDDNAYVSNGTVVMRLPDRVEILFFEGRTHGVRVRLTDAYAFGVLSDDLSEMHPATVAGRWSIIDLLDTGDNIGLCSGTSERRLVETQLDTIADVRSVPGTGGVGVTCDAISLGVQFSGKRARWAGLGPSLPLPNPCE
ncbi:MAG: hypothetical protein KF901_28630 [Myxococcales bacterium]|nr:hypothetical protein [Myxococcales bacterium]